MRQNLKGDNLVKQFCLLSVVVVFPGRLTMSYLIFILFEDIKSVNI